jgi:hypothetical protein
LFCSSPLDTGFETNLLRGKRFTSFDFILEFHSFLFGELLEREKKCIQIANWKRLSIRVMNYA